MMIYWDYTVTRRSETLRPCAKARPPPPPPQTLPTRTPPSGVGSLRGLWRSGITAFGWTAFWVLRCSRHAVHRWPRAIAAHLPIDIPTEESPGTLPKLEG